MVDRMGSTGEADWPSLESGARRVDDRLRREHRLSDLLDRISPQSAGEYAPSAAPALVPRGMTRLPDALLDQYRHLECKSFMGLFPDIRRAWFTVDSRLYLWDYGTHGDFYEYDGLDQIITSVALVRPARGVFVKEVSRVLALATPTEIVLLGVCFSNARGAAEHGRAPCDGDGEIDLYTTQLSSPSDNVNMLAMAGTANGRIFMAGADGHLHELVYGTGGSWFGGNSPQVKKVCHTAGLGSRMIPSFLRLTRADPLVSLAVDDSRQILYALSEASVIHVFDLGPQGDKCERVVSYATLGQDLASRYSRAATYEKAAAERSTDGGSSGSGRHPVRLASVHTVSRKHSRVVHLAGVTRAGVRVYFTTDTGRGGSGAGGSHGGNGGNMNSGGGGGGSALITGDATHDGDIDQGPRRTPTGLAIVACKVPPPPVSGGTHAGGGMGSVVVGGGGGGGGVGGVGGGGAHYGHPSHPMDVHVALVTPDVSLLADARAEDSDTLVAARVDEHSAAVARGERGGGVFGTPSVAEAVTRVEVAGKVWALAEDIKVPGSDSPAPVLALTAHGLTRLEHHPFSATVADALAAGAGAEARIVECYGKEIACAAMLELATSPSASGNISQLATSAFFRHGGRPRIVSLGGPGGELAPSADFGRPAPFADMVHSGCHDGLVTYVSRVLQPVWGRRIITRVDPRSAQFAHRDEHRYTDGAGGSLSSSGVATNTSVLGQGASKNPGASTGSAPSVAYDLTIGPEELHLLITRLSGIAAFLSRNSAFVRGDGVSAVRSNGHPNTVASSYINANGNNGGGSAMGSSNDPAAQRERESLGSLSRLVTRSLEAAQLLSIVRSEGVTESVSAVSGSARRGSSGSGTIAASGGSHVASVAGRIAGMTFRGLATTREGQEAAKAMLSGMLLRTSSGSGGHSAGHAAAPSGERFDELSRVLRERCPGFYGDPDHVRHRAYMLLAQAGAASPNNRASLLDESLRLFVSIAAHVQVRQVCAEYAHLGFYAGVVELGLAVARAIDPEDAALIHAAQVNGPADPTSLDGSFTTAYDDANSVAGPRARYERRLHCYRAILDALGDLLSAGSSSAATGGSGGGGSLNGSMGGNSGFHGVVDPRPVLAKCAASSDRLFHESLYGFLVGSGHAETLLSMETPFVEAWLRAGAERSMADGAGDNGFDGFANSSGIGLGATESDARFASIVADTLGRSPNRSLNSSGFPNAGDDDLDANGDGGAERTEVHDLLWKYYTRHGKNAAAVDVLLRLAERPGAHTRLVRRVHYLSVALGCAKMVPGGGDAAHAVRERLEVAEVQMAVAREIAEIAIAEEENGGDMGATNSVSARETLFSLHASLPPLSQLYQKVIVPHRLWRCALKALQCANATDESHAARIWALLLSDAMRVPGAGVAGVSAAARSALTECRQCGPGVLPLGAVVEILELYAIRVTGGSTHGSQFGGSSSVYQGSQGSHMTGQGGGHGGHGWVVDTLVSSGLSYHAVFDAYHALYAGATGEWADTSARVHLLGSLLALVTRWVDDPATGGEAESAQLRSRRLLDRIDEYVVDLGSRGGGHAQAVARGFEEIARRAGRNH